MTDRLIKARRETFYVPKRIATIERIDQRYLLSKNTERGRSNTIINETG
ncbi:MAG: hypothetical protein FIO02_06740 [Nitrosopumilales archaeon]|nr:hypothetical protein [Nitrosopumilales archaeon]